jgi:glycosyltransferase involved in cell wall biosynthesis
MTDTKAAAGVHGSDGRPQERGPGIRPCLDLSFVIPVYGSPESLASLCVRVKNVCAAMGTSYELILVDDRCPKNSWLTICRLAEDDYAIVGVRLSRNFGQHAAIQAGLSRVRGEWIVVMDCDLQDRPEEVPRLWAKTREGFDVVRAQRINRYDALYRRLLSSAFYGILSYLTDTHQNPAFSNFGIYSRKVIEVVTQWQEEAKYFPAIVSWVGFSQSTQPVEQDRRLSGRSSYTLKKLIRLGMNVIVGFSDKPLKLVMIAGFAMAFLSFSMSLFILVSHLMGILTVEGWASIALSLWFLAGCLLFALGLTGLYVGRILVEVKGRPSFIVDQVLLHSIEDVTKIAPSPVDGNSY